MNPRRANSPSAIFPIAAAISGFSSGIFSNPIVPGLFFGIAMAVAIHYTIGPIRFSSALIFVAISTFGFLLAGVTALVTWGRLGIGNGLVGNSMVGFVSGAVGASVIAVALAIASKSFRSPQVGSSIPMVGAVCGAALAIPIHWHDHCQLAHPLDFILEFMLWQVGVGAAIPLTIDSNNRFPSFHPTAKSADVHDSNQFTSDPP